jgi:hypothetical protein
VFDAEALIGIGVLECARVGRADAENMVDFYVNRGCVLAPEPDPRLLAAEPDDIHLLYPL